MTNPTPHGQVPEALRLADALERPGYGWHTTPAQCAAVLRRLHTENEALRTQQPAPAGATPGAYVNGAGIKADDRPSTVIRKLDARFHDLVTFPRAEKFAASHTPPAEQQVKPGSVYAELPSSVGDYKYGGGLYTDAQMRDFADRTHALRMEQAAPKAEPVPVDAEYGHGLVKVRIDTKPNSEGWCFCTPMNHPGDVARGIVEGDYNSRAQFFGRIEPRAEQRASALPAGWVPLTITHDGQHPEEVAYGPQIMMDRLRKWLDRYFSMRAAPAGEYPALQIITAEDRSLLHYNPNTDDLVEWVQNYARCCINADRAVRAQAAPAAVAVPDGWQLVPVEPTEGMLGAGLRHIDGLAAMPSAYRAMLEAAPQPPAQAQEPVVWQHKKPIVGEGGEVTGYTDWRDGKGLEWWPHRALYTHPAPQQPAPAAQEPDEQGAFESWLESTRPSGDVESVQHQWATSSEYADFLDAKEEWDRSHIVRQPAPAAQGFEKTNAILQSHEIANSDAYFNARPQIDGLDRRNVFRAGFERGWAAAQAPKGGA